LFCKEALSHGKNANKTGILPGYRNSVYNALMRVGVKTFPLTL